MKMKRSKWDTFLYIVMCIFTFGFIALYRVVISEAIRNVIEED